MRFEKIDMQKKWRRLDVVVRQRPKCMHEPIAKISKSKNISTITFNGEAAKLALECGFEGKQLDLYQCGSEFAVTIGESFVMGFYQQEKDRRKYCNICSVDVARRMFNATKCNAFRVSRDGYYLVFTPAYDLNTAQEGETK